MTTTRRHLLEQLAKHDWPELIALYLQVVDSDPKAAIFFASALMHRARHHNRPEELLPTLTMLVAQTDNPTALAFLAKALAAYGRDATRATDTVIARLRALRIVDDETYWAWDSLMHVLGFIGVGPAPRACIDAERRLGAKKRVAGMGALYQGELTDTDRCARFEATLTRVEELLATEKLEAWRNSRTTPQAPEKPANKARPSRAGQSPLTVRQRATKR